MAFSLRSSSVALLQDRRARLLFTVLSAGVGTWLIWWTRRQPVRLLSAALSAGADDDDEDVVEDATAGSPLDSAKHHSEGDITDAIPRPEFKGSNVAEKGPVFAHLRVYVREAIGLAASDYDWHGALTSSDPYCEVHLDEWPLDRRDLEDEDAKATTTIKSATLEPRWNQVFEFKITAANPRLRVEVFDQDNFKRNDPLGTVEVDVLQACPPTQGKSVEGWVQVKPPPRAAKDSRCGALYLGLRWERLDCMGHLLAFVHPAALPHPPFELDKLYSPLVKSTHLISRQLHLPEIAWLKLVLSWSDPALSLFAMLCWIILSANLQYWPTIGCCYLATRMLLIHYKVIQTVHPPADELDEAHLNQVVNTIAYALPNGVQNACRSLQPSLMALASTLQFCVDIQTCRHPASPYIFILLISCSFIAPTLAVGIVGVAVILFSCAWVRGTIQYAICILKCRLAQKHRRVFSTSVPERWLSEAYLMQRK